MTVSVLIDDLATGEGLRRLRHHLPTKTKVEIVQRLATAGMASVEAASFGDELRLADAATVLERLPEPASLAASGGVQQGADSSTQPKPEPSGFAELQASVGSASEAERALAAGVQTLRVRLGMTEASSKRLTGRTMAKSWELASVVAAEILGSEVAGEADWSLVLASAFGCPLTGAVEREAVLKAARQAREKGARRLVLADSGGLATPSSVQELIVAVKTVLEDDVELVFQPAETRGLGLLNFQAAVAVGVRRFETAAAGVGGSPFDMGAPGLIATEDLVHTCDELGLETGIDLGNLIRIGRRFEEATGERMASRMLYVEPRESLLRRFRRPEPPSESASGTAARTALEALEASEISGELS